MGQSDQSRLRQVVASYGADPGRWPEADRVRLASLAGRSSDEPWMREEHDLDRLLDSIDAGGLEPGLAARIANAAKQVPQERDATVIAFPQPLGVVDRVTGVWGQATLLAASLAMGMWLGAAGGLDGLLYGDIQSFAELSVGDTLGGDTGVPWWADWQQSEGFL